MVGEMREEMASSQLVLDEGAPNLGAPFDCRPVHSANSKQVNPWHVARACCKTVSVSVKLHRSPSDLEDEVIDQQSKRARRQAELRAADRFDDLDRRRERPPSTRSITRGKSRAGNPWDGVVRVVDC